MRPVGHLHDVQRERDGGVVHARTRTFRMVRNAHPFATSAARTESPATALEREGRVVTRAKSGPTCASVDSSFASRDGWAPRAEHPSPPVQLMDGNTGSGGEPGRVAVRHHCKVVAFRRCRPASNGSAYGPLSRAADTHWALRTSRSGGAFRALMIVPAPNVARPSAIRSSRRDRRGAASPESPRRREAFGHTVIATGWGDLAGAISPARPGRPSAARKRARSIPRAFGSIGDGRGRDRRGGSDSL